MKGSDLKCECGAGAVDVALDVELMPGMDTSWHCSNGHLLITGTGREGFNGRPSQMRFQEYAKHESPMVRVVAAVAETISNAIDTSTCAAETRAKRNFVNHTHRCQLVAGHEGAHEWKDDWGRTVTWYGEVQPLPVNMRYRFGLDPHWQMKG